MPGMLRAAFAAIAMLGFTQPVAAQAPAPAAAPPTVDCTHDRTTMLALDPLAFDQGPDGWRVLGKPGCDHLGADLIATYRQNHAGKLHPAALSDLTWHEGQLRAAGGDTAAAIPLFETARRESTQENQIYAEATVAFLRNDRPALVAARERLSKVPKPPGFEEGAARFKADHGHDLIWPINLDAVDGFITCFGKPYAVAYGDACRNPAPATPVPATPAPN